MAFVDQFIRNPTWITDLDIHHAVTLTRQFTLLGGACFAIAAGTLFVSGSLDSFWLIWYGLFLVGTVTLYFLIKPKYVYVSGRLGVVLVLFMSLITHFGAGQPFPFASSIGIFGVAIAGSLFDRRPMIYITTIHVLMGIGGFIYWWPYQHLDIERRQLIINAVFHVGTTLAAWVLGVTLVGAYRVAWIESRGKQMLLDKHNREAQLLLSVAHAVQANSPLMVQCSVILQRLCDAIAYDRGLIVRYSQEALRFEPVYGDLFLMDDVARLSQSIQSTQSSTLCFEKIQPAIHSSSVRGQRAQPLQLAYVTLLHQGQCIGVLMVQLKRTLAGEECELIQQFAQYVTIAMINANAHEQSMQTAALAERSRIARELHDSVSQALFGIVLGARTLKQIVNSDHAAHNASNYLLNLSETALAEMRALIFELHPESLQKEGLLIALKKQTAMLCNRHQLKLNLHFEHDEPKLHLRTKEALYRISLEAVQNAIKHAQATQIDLSVRSAAGILHLEIQDNGRGFDPQNPYPGHLGLVSMRERAAEVGAMLLVDSAPNQGVRVCVTMPV